MKHLNFILAGLFFLCGFCCRAQVLPLEENVVLNTKEGQIKGKLLLPGGVKTCPVVLIIAGSGPTDMDGNSAIGNLRNNSLKFLAEGLAANGIASLRFDKRGIGTSASAGKEEAKLRFEDYVNDVTGWIDYLAKEKRFTTITVAGHSEGALIGMLACQNRPKVKGYISVAGAGRPAYEIIEAQVAAQQNPEAVRKEVASINGSLKNGKEVSDVPAYLQSLYRASVQPYLISWFKYNPRTVIASVKVPVLIVQGKNDIQVSVEDAELLKKGCPGVDFLCPRGWCYATRCHFYGDSRAMIWHDGRGDKNKKLVITNSSFDAKTPTLLGRYHHDSQFYLIKCKMSKNVLDGNIHYAYSDKVLDPCPWGLRTYYYGCTREGGHSGWLNDNLKEAENAPEFHGVTAKWTFNGKWDPEQRIRDLWNVLAY